MFTLSNPDIKSMPFSINLTDSKNSYSYRPSSSHFNIAFGLADGKVLTPDIGSFEALYTKQSRYSNSESEKRVKQEKSLRLENCNSKTWKMNENNNNDYLVYLVDNLTCIN